MRSTRAQNRLRSRQGVVRFGAGLLGAAALILTGCSSGDDGDANTSDDTTTVPADAGPSDTEIEVAQGYRTSVGEDLVT